MEAYIKMVILFLMISILARGILLAVGVYPRHINKLDDIADMVPAILLLIWGYLLL